MKAVLEFDLPDENDDFRYAINGKKYKDAIWDYDQLLRSEIRYKELSKETLKAYEFCREELRKILEQDNLIIEQ
jgi:flagellum-specific peptidoglycan hydrolase FlgJ